MWNKEEFECYAINALEYFYSDYKSLVKGESPDYSNDKIGVEITRSITTKDGEIDAFWRKNKNTSFSSLSKKQLRKFGFTGSPVSADLNGILYVQRSVQNGNLYYYRQKATNNYVLCAYMGKSKANKSTSDDVVYSVSVKLNKLNNNYRLFKRNDLCIIIQEQLNYFICQEEIIDNLLNTIILSIKGKYKEAKQTYVFDKIVLLFIDNVFCIDSNTWQYERHIITQEDLDRFVAQMKNQ